MPIAQNPVIHPKYVVAGSFTRDFVIPSDRLPRIDIMGGNAPFTAAGLALWDGPVGILSRVSEDYPQTWINRFDVHEVDHRGVKVLAESLDVRRFYGYNEDGNYQTTSPVGRFAALEYPLPTALLNYTAGKPVQDDLRSRRETSPLSCDMPEDYYDAIAAHLCPMDFLTQNLLQTVIRNGQIKTITLEADPAYLLPENWNSVHDLLSGLSCFTVDESDISLFFRSRTTDIQEMAMGLGAMGCEHIIIRRKDGGKLLFEHSSHRSWQIPDYPIKVINRHSARHAFCGGFLAGYLLTYDPLMAAAYGCISEAVAGECLDPLEVFETLPGLLQARLKSHLGHVKLL